MEYYLDNHATWVIKNSLLKTRHELTQDIEVLLALEPEEKDRLKRLENDKKDIEDVMDTLGCVY